MLKEVTKTITLTSESLIDGVAALRFVGTVNSANPEDVTLSSVQVNKALYKANRKQCREDEAAFEDYVYSLQDDMIASTEKAENTDTAEEA